MAIDKFSKWIKARPIVNVCSEEVVAFFTDIIYRFGIPTRSLPTTAPSSRERNFSTFETTATFAWIGPPWRTRRQTDKSRGQTA
jgi:hypothetical protein